MLRWFEKTDEKRPGVISSRIRLVRNWEEYKFPAMLGTQESEEMVRRLEFGLKDLSEVEGRKYEYAMLEELEELDRAALRERRIINRAAVEKKAPAGIILSEDEDTSILLNGDDHIRLQLLSSGLHLEELWERADVLDDYINERFPYAFDDRYGYLTSFPTNVGTGMRASVVVHLPMLSSGRKFPALIADMSRFGTAVRGVYGEGEDFYTAKGLFECLAAQSGIRFEYEAAEKSFLHPGKCANVLLGGEVVGYLGEFAPDLAAQLSLETSLYLGELDYAKVAQVLAGRKKYVALPKFAEVKRDLALVTAESTTCAEVEKVIRESCKYLTDVHLFDVYRGAQVGEGKKSMAFSVTFTPKDKAISPEDADGYVRRILKALHEKAGAELR